MLLADHGLLCFPCLSLRTLWKIGCKTSLYSQQHRTFSERHGRNFNGPGSLQRYCKISGPLGSPSWPCYVKHAVAHLDGRRCSSAADPKLPARTAFGPARGTTSRGRFLVSSMRLRMQLYPLTEMKSLLQNESSNLEASSRQTETVTLRSNSPAMDSLTTFRPGSAPSEDRKSVV